MIDELDELTEEEQRLAAATDEEGEWRSLGHRKQFLGEAIPGDPGAPDPFHYSVEQEEDFNRELTVFEQKKATREGVREALTPRPGPSLPDDELSKERDEARRWEAECLHSAETCLFQGDYEAAKAWRERAQFKNKDLADAGPTLGERVVKDLKLELSKGAVDLLFDPANDNNPIWDHRRMQHDSMVEVHRLNRTTNDKTLRLPLEVSEWGNVETLRPRNMCSIELPDQKTMDEVREFVYHSPVNEPTELFRRTWAILRKLGYAGKAKLAIPRSTPKTESEEQQTNNPDLHWQRMSQKQFEAMREKQGAPRT